VTNNTHSVRFLWHMISPHSSCMNGGVTKILMQVLESIDGMRKEMAFLKRSQVHCNSFKNVSLVLVCSGIT
jgi:hypothetical protein